MRLRRALRVDWTRRSALVGAGGKTTTLFQMARSYEPPVLVTATTHMGEWQSGFADRHCVITRPEDVFRFAGMIEGVTLFTGDRAGEGQQGGAGRLSGLSIDSMEGVRALADDLGFPVLIEADGARQRALKAPGDHEPVIPEWVEQVIVVAGMSGLDQPLDEAVVHRPERFSRLSGLAMGEPVTADALVRVLTHPEGGLKGLPQGVRRVALLNQVDDARLLALTHPLVEQLAGVYDSVIVGSVADRQILSMHEPAAGIVLAAGGSSRLGRAKVLLPWNGKPLIRWTAEAAITGGLSPVLVVTGEAEAEVRAALDGLAVEFVPNPGWQAGQSTSIRAGLERLSQKIGSAVFLLGDQPFVSGKLVRELVERHASTLAPVVAPRVGERRSNPVLFDRSTFADLLALQGDTGGRAILGGRAVEYVDWPDERLLLDIDTEEDYRRLLGMAEP